MPDATVAYLFARSGTTNVRFCRSQGEVGGTVASDWVTNLDRYGDPVLPWSGRITCWRPARRGRAPPTGRFVTFSGCQPVSVRGTL